MKVLFSSRKVKIKIEALDFSGEQQRKRGKVLIEVWNKRKTYFSSISSTSDELYQDTEDVLKVLSKKEINSPQARRWIRAVMT